MNKYELKTGMVVGTSRNGCYSQVVAFSYGYYRYLLLVSLRYTGESDVLDLSQVGAAIIASAQDSFAKDDGSQKLEDQLKTCLGESQVDVEPSFLIVRLASNKISVYGVGEGALYLARHGKIAKIYGGGALVKGMLSEGDRLVVATRAVEHKLIAQIKQLLRDGKERLEDLAIAVRAEDDSSDMAVIWGELQKREETEKSDRGVRIRAKLGQMDPRGFVRHILSRPISIRKEQKKLNMWVGASLLIILVVGVVVGVVRRGEMVLSRAYAETSETVQQKIDEARSVGDLNPERARYLLVQARGEVDSYRRKLEDPTYITRADELLGLINEAEVEVFRKQEVTLNTLIELDVLKKNMVTSQMALDDRGDVLLADEASNQIEAINLGDKSSFEVEVSQVGKIRAIAASDKTIYALTEQGVATIPEKGGGEVVITPDELWNDVTVIGTYGGSVYLLDRGQGEIWKYPALSEGYGARRRWLGAGIILDLSKVVDMKVDGDIWLLTSSGKLERYSRGVPLAFGMEGMPYISGDRMMSPSALFVSEDKVYILENGAKRVVVFDIESGKYLKQYENEELDEGKDIVEEGGKVYVLLPDKIVWFAK